MNFFSLFAHSHLLLCFAFFSICFFRFLYQNGGSVTLRLKAKIPPQAPAALGRLYGVVSMVTVTSVMAISADWSGTSEVEKEQTG